MLQRILNKIDRVFGLSKRGVDISCGFFPLNIFELDEVQNLELGTAEISENYDSNYESDQWIQKPEYLFLINQLTETYKPRSMLDIGCGEGKLLSLASEQHDCVETAIGVDISRSAIENAEKLHADNRKLSFAASPIETMSFDVKYDMIFAIGSLEHMLEPDLSLVFDCIAPNGIFVMIVPTCGPFHPNRDRFVRKGFQTEWWLTRKKWRRMAEDAGFIDIMDKHRHLTANFDIRAKRWTFVFQRPS